MNRIAFFTIALAVPIATVATARPAETPAPLLAGRVAGPPRQCLPGIAADRGGQIYRDGSILYRTQSSTIYVTHARDCPQLHPNLAIVSRQTGGRLCAGDIVEVIDPRSPATFGACPLGEFVPYDRPPRR